MLLAKLSPTQVLDYSQSRNFLHPEIKYMQPALLRGPQRALGAAEETPGVVYSLYASHGRTDARRLLSSRHLTLPLCSSPSPGWKGLLCCFEGHGLHSVRDRDRSDLCPPGLVSSRTEPGFFFRLFFFPRKTMARNQSAVVPLKRDAGEGFVASPHPRRDPQLSPTARKGFLH